MVPGAGARGKEGRVKALSAHREESGSRLNIVHLSPSRITTAHLTADSDFLASRSTALTRSRRKL